MPSDTSISSATYQTAADKAVRSALAELSKEWGRDNLAAAEADFNLFETIDSFAVVELLLQTEGEVEKATGRYIPLADETVLDFEKSPLRRLDSWIAYVAGAMARG